MTPLLVRDLRAFPTIRPSWICRGRNGRGRTQLAAEGTDCLGRPPWNMEHNWVCIIAHGANHAEPSQRGPEA